MDAGVAVGVEDYAGLAPSARKHHHHRPDLGAARGGDAAGAEEFDARLHALYHFLAVEPNPIPLKALLALNGIGVGLRLPLQPLSSLHAAEAERLHADILQLEQRCRPQAA